MPKFSFIRLSILSVVLVFNISLQLQAQSKCIDLGVGIGVENGELAFIDFFKGGGKWEPVGNNGHPWYKVYSLDTFKVVNGAYYNWDIDWSGSVNNEAWGNNWADCFISFWDMLVDQGKIRPDGYPKQFPVTVYKYKPKSADANQGIDITKPVSITEFSRRIYFPKNLTANGWVLRWKGRGRISFEGMEVTDANIPYTDLGNSWTADGNYAGKNYEFSSTSGGRVVNRHFWMVHGWVLRILESDPNDPIRDIEYIYPGQEANYDAGQRFNPLFLERMRQFKCLRYMGYLSSNDIQGRRVMAEGHPFHDSHMLAWLRWDERTPENYYQINNGNGGNYEYIINLSNQTGTNPWINVPYCADEHYTDSLVRLFMERLNPDLTLYIEVGNELWNFGADFNGFFWQARKRVREFPGLGDVEARGAYLNRIFKQVTETAGSRNLARMQRVYGAFPRYYDVNNRTVQMIDPSYWDALATTWYFSLDANNTTENHCLDPQTGTNWRSVLYNWYQAHPGDQNGFNQTYRNCLLNEFRCQGGYRNNVDVVLANYYKKKVICYEGGNHTFYGCSNGPTGNKLDGELEFDTPAYPNYITNNGFINAVSTADESPEMGEVFNEVIDSLQAAGFELANHLSFAGTSSCYGVWNLIQSRDIEAPLSTLLNRYNKFRVFSERIQTNNCDQVNITLEADTVGPGLSIMLDGINDYIEGSTTFVPDENSNYTFETWIKPQLFDREQVALSFSSSGANDNYNTVKIRTDRKVVWEIGNNTAFTAKLVGPVLEAENWYHIAAVKNGNRYTLFVNGVNVANNNFTLSPASRNRFTIGALYRGTSCEKFFTGEMDEVRIWNAARSIENIRGYMCKKINVNSATSTALRTYYRFDNPDYSGLTLLDNTTRTQNGFLRNITITERSRFAVSGAPIGDLSNNIYPSSWNGVSLSLSHPQNDRVAVYNINNSNPAGIHVYMFDGKSHYIDKPEYYTDISESRVVGVFTANGRQTNYDLSYIYNGNPDAYTNGGEDDLRLLRRNNYSTEQWLHAGANIDRTANALTVSCKENYRGEYTLGHRNSIRQIRPGSGTALFDNQTPTGNVMGKLQYLNLDNFTVTFWARGYGEVFNFTSRMAANGCRFTLNNNWGDHTGCEIRYGVHWTYDVSFGPNTNIAEHTEWHHYAVTKDNSKIRIFQDGMEIATGDVTQQFHIDEMYLFNAPAWQAGNFPGQVANLTLDELTVWDIPLDQNTIREWMCKKINREHPYACKNLKLYFNFDENTGSVLEDKFGPSDIVLTTDSQGFQWVKSAAAIGDVSSADYSSPENITFNHPDGDFLEANRTTGTCYGVHLYRVNNMPPVPAASNSTSIQSLDSSRYWGLYIAKPYNTTPAYSVINHFEKNSQVDPAHQSELRMLSRTDNSVSPWNANISVLPDITQHTLTLTGQSRGEYILGGTTSNTFNDFTPPLQPVFLGETQLINKHEICGNSAGLLYKLQRDPLSTSYVWTLSSGLEGFSTGDSIIINSSYTGNAPLAATIIVKAVNTYGESPETMYAVTINPRTTVADAGPDQILIPPVNIATMDGNFPAVTETASWLLTNGSGNITDLHFPGTTVTNLAVGGNYFTWDIESISCSNSIDTVRILVAPSPENILMTDNSPIPLVLCQGTVLNIKAIPAEDIAPDSYQWIMPGGLTLVSQSGDEATISVGNGIGGIINVSAIYNGSASLPFSSQPVNINAQPQRPIFVDRPSNLCLNVNATASIQYNSNIDSVEWTLPYGVYPTQFPKSTTENIEIEAIDITSGYIKAQVFNDGCTNSSAVDSFMINVGQAPSKPELYLGTDGGTADAVCANSNVLLWVKNPDNQVMYEWRWNTSVEFTEYFNDNHSGALFRVSNENNDIWVRAVQGTGTCNASEWYNFYAWPQQESPASITNVSITNPAGQNPLALSTGQSYSFSVNGNAERYYWNIPEGFEWVNDGEIADSANTIRVTAAMAGYLEVYPVTLRGCTGNPYRLSIGTNGALLPPTFVSGNTEICQGTYLNITVTNVSGATQYVWNLPDNSSYTTTNSVLNQIIPNSMSGLLRVVAIKGSIESSPLEIPIKINPVTLPDIVFTDASNNPVNELEICNSDNSRPIYIRDGLASQYIWDIRGSAIQFEPRYQPGYDGNNNYELNNRISPTDTLMPVSWVGWRCRNDGTDGGYIIVRAINGCGGSPRIDSIHYYWARPLNIFVPEFTKSAKNLCVGSIANFEIKPIPGADQYIWHLPNGLSANEVITSVPSISVRVSNGTGGTVNVFATGSVCGGTQTAENSSLPVNISGTPVDFHFIDQPLAACPGDPLTFSVNDIGAASYLWQLPGAMRTTIVDDSEVPTSAITGGWSTTVRGNMINGQYRHTNNNSATKRITYTPNLPYTGRYRVSLSYFQDYGAMPDLPVIINSAEGSSTQYVNLSIAPNDGIWQVLGEYNFNRGNSGSIIISADASNDDRAIADAVRFEIIGIPGDTSIQLTTNTGLGGAVCVSVNLQQCSSEYTICTDPVNVSGNMTVPSFSVQENAVCSGLSYTFKVNDIGAESYTWNLPPGMSIGNQTGIVPGQQREVLVHMINNTGASSQIGVHGVISSCNVLSDAVYTNPILFNGTACIVSNPIFMSQPSAICKTGNPVTYSVSNIPTSEGYEWFIPTGLQQTGTNATGNIYTMDPFIIVEPTPTAAGTLGNIQVRALSSVLGNSEWVYTLNPITVITAPEQVSVDFINISSCNATDGAIQIGLLSPLTTYAISYFNGSLAVGPENHTSNPGGFISIPIANPGIYGNITIDLDGCATTTTEMKPINNSSGIQITNIQALNPSQCGGTGLLKIAIFGAIQGDTYQVDYESNGVIDNTGTVDNDTIVFMNIPIGTRINNPVIIHQLSNCRTSGNFAGTIVGQGTPLITGVRFINPDTCGGNGSIQIVLSGSQNGDNFTIAFENNATANRNGTVNRDTISIPDIPINIVMTGVYLTNTRSSCSGNIITQNNFVIQPEIAISDVRFINPNGCSNSGLLEVQLTGASPTDQFNVDYNNDGSINANGRVQSGVLTLNGLLPGQSVNGLTLIHTTSGCKKSTTRNGIIPLPVKPDVFLADLRPVCVNSGPLQLEGGSPSGGQYFINGSQTNVADPQQLGQGTFDVIYRYADTNNCENTDSASLVINPLPVAEMTGEQTLCPLTKNVAYNVPFNAENQYSWSVIGGDLYQGTDVASAYVNWTNATQGQVNVKVINTSTLCTDSSFLNIQFVDAESPVITNCLPSVHFQASSDGNSRFYTISAPDTLYFPKATDRCSPDNLIMQFSLNGGSFKPANELTGTQIKGPATNIINWQVSDVSGNISECTTSLILDYDVIPPTAFSPNGDEINDTWEIDFLIGYPQCIVKVYNRWGMLIYESEKGYPRNWDGRSNGNLVPLDTYYYIISLGNDEKLVKGYVTIVY